MKKLFVPTLLLMSLCCVTSNAQLHWETTEVEIEPEPGQREVVTEFSFENKGDYPLTITSFKATEGSVDVSYHASSKTVKPGAKGVVRLTWQNMRKIRRPLEATAVVVTDEANNSQYQLTSKLYPSGFLEHRRLAEARKERLSKIPSPLSIEPRSLRWEIGDKPEPKSVTINVVGGPLMVDGVMEDALGASPLQNDRFNYEWEVVDKDREYRLTVTPVSTDKTKFGRFTLKAEFEGDVAAAWPMRLFTIRAVVLSPPPVEPSETPSSTE